MNSPGNSSNQCPKNTNTRKTHDALSYSILPKELIGDILMTTPLQLIVLHDKIVEYYNTYIGLVNQNPNNAELTTPIQSASFIPQTPYLKYQYIYTFKAYQAKIKEDIQNYNETSSCKETLAKNPVFCFKTYKLPTLDDKYFNDYITILKIFVYFELFDEATNCVINIIDFLNQITNYDQITTTYYIPFHNKLSNICYAVLNQIEDLYRLNRCEKFKKVPDNSDKSDKKVNQIKQDIDNLKAIINETEQSKKNILNAVISNNSVKTIINKNVQNATNVNLLIADHDKAVNDYIVSITPQLNPGLSHPLKINDYADTTENVKFYKDVYINDSTIKQNMAELSTRLQKIIDEYKSQQTAVKGGKRKSRSTKSKSAAKKSSRKSGGDKKKPSAKKTTKKAPAAKKPVRKSGGSKKTSTAKKDTKKKSSRKSH